MRLHIVQPLCRKEDAVATPVTAACPHRLLIVGNRLGYDGIRTNPVVPVCPVCSMPIGSAWQGGITIITGPRQRKEMGKGKEKGKEKKGAFQRHASQYVTDVRHP